MTARRNALLTISALAGFGALVATPARASQIDISPFVDSNLRGGGYTNGTMYPVGGSTVTIGAVDFKLAPVVGDVNGTGVIQYDIGEADRVIPIGEIGVTTVYTLINSGFGSLGTFIG
ncbi:MAG: hypothetical protein H0X36_12125 [Sphingomonadaceae bacterium]|nr:hypothetical protein [Sphingomonadaceae bacterium]